MILFDPHVSIIPLPTLVIDEASFWFKMELEATTEYTDLPSAIANRLEGSVV